MSRVFFISTAVSMLLTASAVAEESSYSEDQGTTIGVEEVSEPDTPERSLEKAKDFVPTTTNTVCSRDVNVGTGTTRNPAYAWISVEIRSRKYVFGVTGKAADNDSGYSYPFPICYHGGECAIGWSKFIGDWSSSYERNKRIISWRFKNWKHNSTRTAYICVDTN